MRANTLYPEYNAIQKHIDAARIGRVVDIAESIADMIMAVVREIQSPPPQSPWLVEMLARMKESRSFVRLPTGW
ncbi:MAG TPA: hypothetical protein VM122_09465 [Usitatibacter sp.]|nr:hypothetical protein [Usitatibacter sp.]